VLIDNALTWIHLLTISLRFKWIRTFWNHWASLGLLMALFFPTPISIPTSSQTWRINKLANFSQTPNEKLTANLKLKTLATLLTSISSHNPFPNIKFNHSWYNVTKRSLTNPLNFASSSPTTYDKANIMNFVSPTQQNFKE